jgi:hypothetical protein
VPAPAPASDGSTPDRYVELYENHGAEPPAVMPKRIHPFQAATKSDDGGVWRFTLGILLDERPGAVPNLRIFIAVEFGPRLDQRNIIFRLPPASDAEFTIDIEAENPFTRIFDRIFEILRGFVTAPTGSSQRQTLGFAVTS